MSKSMTIGAMRFDVVADTQDFEKDMLATRNELRQASKVMRDTRTPAEKLGERIERLNNLRKKGLIDQKAYNRSLKAEKEAYEQVDREAKQYNSTMERLKRSKAQLAIGLGVVAAAAASVTRAFMMMREQIQIVNDLAKMSKSLRVSFNDLQTFGLMAKSVGKDAEMMNDVLREMEMRAAEAATGTGEAAEAIARLGINIDDYLGTDAKGKFDMVSAAIRELNDVGKQTFALGQLAGGEAEDLLSIFQRGPELFEANSKAIEEFGLAMDQDAVASVERANAALARLQQRLEGFKRSFIGGEKFAAQLIALESMMKPREEGDTRSVVQRAKDANQAVYDAEIKAAAKAEDEKRHAEIMAAAAAEEAIKKAKEAAEAKAAKEKKDADIKRGIEIAKAIAAEQKAIDEARDRDNQARAQRKQAKLEEQRKAAEARVTDAEKALKEFDSKREKTFKASGIGAARQGSREEYQLRVQMQRQRQESEARRRAEERADARRATLQDTVDQQVTALQDIQAKLDPTVGV